MQSKNSKCLSIWPETFFCQECSSALGSSIYSPQTHRPGGCFLMPPPSIGGIQVIFTGSRGQNMPPGVEKELEFQIEYIEAGQSSNIGVLCITILNMECIRNYDMILLNQNLWGKPLDGSAYKKLIVLFDDGSIGTSSCWTTDDFKDQSMILIQKLKVQDPWKGLLEPWLLPKIFSLKAAKDVRFILMEIQEQEQGEIKLFRELQIGFRRVAYSEFFCLAKDPHPSQAVKAKDDDPFRTQPVPIPGWAHRNQNCTMHME
ncbi:hypothetical protein B0H13DRAFT_1855763 [Mycena leptocephala]|nr:hypothetical protein B0H13DRAFT_1855763 [Mycena leptocephala]